MSRVYVSRLVLLVPLSLAMPTLLVSCSGKKGQPVARNQPDKAISDFTDAMARRPNDAKLICQRGERYAELGQVDKAIVDFTTAIRLRDASAHIQRAALYEKRQNYVSAIADYTRFIELYGTTRSNLDNALEHAEMNAKAHYRRGLCYDVTGAPDKAIDDYKAAAAFDPNLLDETTQKRIAN